MSLLRAAMTLIGFFVMADRRAVEIFFQKSCEQVGYIAMLSFVVALQCQNIVATAGNDLVGNVSLTACGVDRNHRVG